MFALVDSLGLAVGHSLVALPKCKEFSMHKKCLQEGRQLGEVGNVPKDVLDDKSRWHHVMHMHSLPFYD